MENFELDGIYFRVCREDRWQNICLSDLTLSEYAQVVGFTRPKSWYQATWERLMECWQEISHSCLSDEEQCIFNLRQRVLAPERAMAGPDEVWLLACFLHQTAAELGIRRVSDDE